MLKSLGLGASMALMLASVPVGAIQQPLSRRAVLAAPAAGAALGVTPLLVPPSAAGAATGALKGGARVPLKGPTGPKDGFPLASFGLQVYDDQTAYDLTLLALDVGYRNFFASVLAGNQRGFARAVKDSGIPREELYICGTVLSNRAKGEKAAYDKTALGCAQNMGAMAAGNIGHLDMIMLDYPGPDDESIRGQWRAFEDMKKDGLVDSLAVSNFSPQQLDVILAMPGVTKPTVNQLPYSLAYHPKNILEYNTERGILVQSWSPLSRVLPGKKSLPVLADIGKKYGKSEAQVALRWIVQTGASYSCQSKSRAHFAEDLNVFDFELTADEVKALSALAA